MVKVTDFGHPFSRSTGALGSSFVVWLVAFLAICIHASDLLALGFAFSIQFLSSYLLACYGASSRLWWFLCVLGISFCLSILVLIKLLLINPQKSMNWKLKYVRIFISFEHDSCVTKYMFTSECIKRKTNTLVGQWLVLQTSSMLGSLWCKLLWSLTMWYYLKCHWKDPCVCELFYL